MDEIRITPENLKQENIGINDVFVFGSNEAGIHGAGAARFAADELKASWGKGFGFTNWDNRFHTFAIPTKDWNVETLKLSEIIFYVHRFIEFTILHPKFKFYVTQIGCGYAGYTPEDIAPMFAVIPDNVVLNESFRNFLNKQHE